MYTIKPTFWKEVLEARSGEVVMERVGEGNAHFISSLMENDAHRMLLDIDRSITFDERSICAPWASDGPPERAVEWVKLGHELEQANLGSLQNGQPGVLCFSHPVLVYPSSSRGHFHFVMDLPDDRLMRWGMFQNLLESFHKVGLIEYDWMEMVIRKKMAPLLKPGVSKETAYALRRSRLIQYSGRDL